MTPTFLTRVCRELDRLVADVAAEHGEDPARGGLLIALSGGADSVALLDAAMTWAGDGQRQVIAAHFHHQLRDAAADDDQAHCQSLCDRWGVPLVGERGDVRGLARQRGRGLEDAARHLRWQFLERVRREHGLTAIATGHHRDDQIETVVMRMFRGTGLDGLRGIRPVHGRRVRPLLGCDRAEVVEHLLTRGLTWRDDATNTDGSNRRSRLRQELLPLVRDIFGDGATATPARLAGLIETDLAYLDRQAGSAWDAVQTEVPPGLAAPALSVSALGALPPAILRRVIRRWLGGEDPADLELVHVETIRQWLATGRSGDGLDLPGGVRIERVFDAVGLARPVPLAEPLELWRVTVRPLDEVPDPVPAPEHGDQGWQLVCPAEALRGSLRLRHPREGDRLEPFGLGGSKKLSDLARERRIPTSQRAQLLIVEDDTGPLWIPGLAQAERTRVLPTTRQAVTIFVSRRTSPSV